MGLCVCVRSVLRIRRCPAVCDSATRRVRAGGVACSPKLVTTSDSEHQSAPDQHGHDVERSIRRVARGVVLRNPRNSVQNDVEVAGKDES